ncbi:DUF2690 domain-containing protein [Streptomyces sp. NPDC049099]|uniref:helix-turn-helix domain-containing protein n=1 Tax=Streptomyces sp. NPDC049099 TaxID=3155768 RepID=UPI003430869E
MSNRDLPAVRPEPGSDARLHAELLALKQRSGLSYARISALTHYSKSSWERWINGKQFPPRGAVESFARAARTQAAPLLDLWEQAELLRVAGADPAEQPLAVSEGEPAPPENGDPTAGPPGGSDPEPAVPGPDRPRPAAPEPGAAEQDMCEPAVAGPTVPGSADTAGDGGASAGGAGFVRRQGRGRLIAMVAAACVAVAAAGVAVVRYSSDNAEDGSHTAGGRASASHAAAHGDPVGCTHAGCTGKDPMTMGCVRDGQTLALIRNQNMVIELRYSSECGAAWGRITYAKPKAVVDVDNSSGTTEATPVHWGNDVYSPMAELGPGQTAWACGTQPDGKSRTCTTHSPVPAGH